MHKIALHFSFVRETRPDSVLVPPLPPPPPATAVSDSGRHRALWLRQHLQAGDTGIASSWQPPQPIRGGTYTRDSLHWLKWQLPPLALGGGNSDGLREKEEEETVVTLRTPEASRLLAACVPACCWGAMGNVPSALKHCLSYQHLLKEQLWIGEPASPQQPRQVLESATIRASGRRGGDAQERVVADAPPSLLHCAD